METSQKATSRSVDTHFTEEHRALDRILRDVEFLSQRRSFEQAAKRLGEFRRSLEEHQAAEEEVLLALFLERTGDPDGVVPVMRADHEQLVRLLNQLSSALSRWDYTCSCEVLRELDTSLKSHHLNEERVLHPALDLVLRNEADWYVLINRNYLRKGQPLVLSCSAGRRHARELDTNDPVPLKREG